MGMIRGNVVSGIDTGNLWFKCKKLIRDDQLFSGLGAGATSVLAPVGTVIFTEALPPRSGCTQTESLYHIQVPQPTVSAIGTSKDPGPDPGQDSSSGFGGGATMGYNLPMKIVWTWARLATSRCTGKDTVGIVLGICIGRLPPRLVSRDGPDGFF